VFELSKVEHLHVRQAMVGHLRHINEDLAKRVANGLELEELPTAPASARPVRDMPLSPALQIIGKMKDTLEGRAIGILIAEGSDWRADQGDHEGGDRCGATNPESWLISSRSTLRNSQGALCILWASERRVPSGATPSRIVGKLSRPRPGLRGSIAGRA
jgi:hypothetical protein